MKIRFSNLKQSVSGTRVLGSLFCIALLILCNSVVANAQVVTAAVRGTVTDEQGAALAGADVTITNVDTGFARSTKSGTDGEYNFPDLPLGPYKIHVTHTGFKAETQTGIVLHVADSIVVNVSLKVGAVSETVTVEASPIAVETTNGELTGLIQGSQVQELPLNGRNFMQLVTLMPGVAAAEAFSTREKGIKGASDLSVSGSPSNGNQWLVDGANNNDTGSQRTILIYPSTESIEEFKIERNGYGAEFGLMSGATVNLVTKSGTNDFHGSVFYSGRNDKLDAYNPLLKDGCPTPLSPVTCPKNKLRENDFGYTVGGPIIKDKVFFFWDEEWNRKIEGLVTTSHVPGMAERTGDFSQVAACSFFPKGGLTDPHPGDPGGPFTIAPGTSVPDVIPQARVTSQSTLLMSEYPGPTLSNPCTNLNWTKSQNTPSPWREENVRGDVNLTKTMRLMVKYTQNAWVLGPPSAGFGWGNNPLGVIDESWDQPSRIAAARLSKTIGANIVNDFQFSYSANRINLAQSNPALVQQINDAIPFFYPTSGKMYGDKGPSAWFSGWGNAHLPSVWTIAPWHNAQDLYTWQDDLSIVKGPHTLKFGGITSKNSKNEQTPNSEFGGIFGAVGYQGQWGNKTGYDVADMELKNMAISMGEASNITINDIRWRNTEFYAADNWRMTPRFTLSYGVRYSLLPNPYFADDLYTSFNPSAYSAALGTDPCNGLLYSPGLAQNPCLAIGAKGGIAGPNRALWNNNNHMIAPRLSFAWDPTGKGKWAIRAGGGQFFNRDRLFALQIGGTNPPFVKNFTDPNGRFLDSLTPPTAGPAFSNAFGGASIGGETSNQMPNSWQYNLTVQHELWKDTRLEVGYVANRNMHWEIRSDVNAIAPANRLAYFQDNGCTDANGNANGLCVDSGGNPIKGAAARQALRPFGPMRGDTGLTYYTHSGQSSYDSLQALFQTRFQRNSQLQLAYTWSKLISDTQLIDTPNNNLDFYNPRAQRGPDQLNRPQIVALNWIYNLPTLQNQSNYLRTAFGSWELSSIYSYATGPSMTGFIGNSPVGDPSGTGAGGNEVPMRVPGQPCRANTGDIRQWFNPNMFTLNGMKVGTKGSEGFGVCSGPGNSVMDLSFRKNFKLTERVKMQFTFDLFNLFNHPLYQASSIGGNGEFGVNFNGPARVADNPNSALYLDSAGNPIYPRSATPGSTGCGTNHLASATGTSPEVWCASTIENTTIGNNFGVITGTRENGFRQLQYGLTFRF